MEKIATLTTLDQKLAKLKERVEEAQQRTAAQQKAVQAQEAEEAERRKYLAV